MNADSTNVSDGLLAEFCEEAMEALEPLPGHLARFAEQPGDMGPIHEVFRAVHTVKGNAGFFGLGALKMFAHALEDALDVVRQGGVTPSPRLLELLTEAVDRLTDMVAEVGDRGGDAGRLAPEDERLLDGVREEVSRLQETAAPAVTLLCRELETLAESMKSEGGAAATWAERIAELVKRFDTTQKEEDAGEATRSSAPEGESPGWQDLFGKRFQIGDRDVSEDVQALLGLWRALDEGEDIRAEGGRFLEACQRLIAIVEAQGGKDAARAIGQVRDDVQTLLESPLELDELLLSVVWDRLGPALTAWLDEEMGAAKPSEGTRAPESGKGRSEARGASPDSAPRSRFLRVREERIDEFLEDVSSLFITIERLKDLQSRMAQRTSFNELVDELRQVNVTLSQQSTALQQSVVELRKVPVRELFSKFPRVARNLARQLGKEIQVHLEGEEVEIDKSLVSDLDGPLMHMVRNVCDHGIESPEEREGLGKPRSGNLRIKCHLSKTHVVITVEDDGRGIDPNRLRTKAIEKGILSEQAARAMPDDEAVELIFHPGFSTADQVTEVSGRGVGLDAVRTQLRQHSGDIRVESTLGVGTRFELVIPIRRAVVVIDGLLVRALDAVYVIPFEYVQEIVPVAQARLTGVGNRPVATVRGDVYPARALDDLLLARSAAPPRETFRDGVVIRHRRDRLFLLVESVVGQRKVVVTDLSDVLPGCDHLGGVAQLGGGKLALVVSGPELLKTAAGLG